MSLSVTSVVHVSSSSVSCQLATHIRSEEDTQVRRERPERLRLAPLQSWALWTHHIGERAQAPVVQGIVPRKLPVSRGNYAVGDRVHGREQESFSEKTVALFQCRMLPPRRNDTTFMKFDMFSGMYLWQR